MSARIGSCILVPLVGLVAAVACAGRPAVRLSTSRVVATPVPSPAPAPKMAATSVDGIVFPEYPPLDNPGGGILWRPSANAGPWPTDGTIAMPALGVKAPIVRVGVDAKTNSMVTPRNARDVAWLDQGPFPGVQQNAVLAGHKNWSGRTGSFDGLARLRNGDPVVVTFGARTWTFKIVWVRLYDPRNAPVDKLMGLTSAPSVTLITCGGAFDRSIRHYRGRVIARAELVQAPSV